MKAHIVLAHPEPTSFNGQLASVSQGRLGANGYTEITFSDLYAMAFDPREGPQHYADRANPDVFHTQTEQRYNHENGTTPPEVASEMQRLLDCDLLVVHFPLWWFGMPAMLKGWMDRVFVYGPVYRSTMRYDTGNCAGKRFLACVTTGANERNCAYNGREGDTRLHLWPILYPFRYLGFTVYEPEILHDIGSTSFMEGREDGLGSLESYKDLWIRSLDGLPSRSIVNYNSDRDFDETKRLLPDAPSYSPFIRHSP